MYCHRCGKQLPDGSEFCNRCGVRMKSQEERLRRPVESTPPVRQVRPPQPAQPTTPSNPPPPPRPSRRRQVVDRPVVRPPVREEEERYYDPFDSYEPEEPLYDPDYREFQKQENVIFRIHPAFFEVGTAYFLGIAASLLMAGFISFIRAPIWFTFIFAIFFLIPAISRHIKLIYTVYTLTEIKVEIQSGLFSKKRRNIPLRNIHDVYVSETFKERLVGIGDVIIDSAASSGSITMENINNPRYYTDLILDQLQRWN